MQKDFERGVKRMLRASPNHYIYWSHLEFPGSNPSAADMSFQFILLNYLTKNENKNKKRPAFSNVYKQAEHYPYLASLRYGCTNQFVSFLKMFYHVVGK